MEGSSNESGRRLKRTPGGILDLEMSRTSSSGEDAATEPVRAAVLVADGEAAELVASLLAVAWYAFKFFANFSTSKWTYTTSEGQNLKRNQ
jgi:hypothetical protein